ncbi:multidrug resistance efflux transporter family protein [Aquibacillus halophilus]|uniref:Multidrug resistance efflux transporter family protein n=1 Tax=Aquibacillus halophilus TaxID=930132 RepID=A0A6A8DD32_9BACI|nr:multidrug resistance efflux transporter family protein [Aquibacillus halophilus]MRH41691.1 multidrug resistance efflux transporter family protein [Aquibacillus halophilus]
MKEILIGILASMFFAVTFILNRSMELEGGSWIWSSSLRFLFMFPFLLLIVLLRHNLKQVINEMLKQPFQWLGWSFVGFVLFYASLTYAAAYGPGWLVAGTWQLTIVAGTLLGPFFFTIIQTEDGPLKIRNKLQLKALCISLIILIGVSLIQLQKANNLTIFELIIGILPVIIAAFAYPLGNRKMMEVCDGKLDTFQRVFGMTLASLPFWLVISIFGLIEVGGPTSSQLLQSFIVAICSGVIATTLFFIATDRVKGEQGKLAAVEATQSTQVLFVMIGEVLLLSTPLPSGLAIVGLFIIILGMFLHSYFTKNIKSKQNSIRLYKSE